MDRHLPDDQLDRALLGFFSERQDELLATAPTPHLVAARIAATASPTTVRPRQSLPLVLVALLVMLLAAAAAVVGSGLLRPSPIPADRGVFTPTGSLSMGAGNARAVRLQDGRVLVVGGYTDGDTSTVELFDPKNGTFDVVATLPYRVEGHTLTLLSDGRVLFVGGNHFSGAGGPVASAAAEIWDPRTASFTATGSLTTGRSGHIAVLLHDGRVLVAGGTGAAEIWDPATGAFAPAGWPEANLLGIAAALLDDGRVVLVGAGRVQIWDPASDSSISTARPIPGHVAFEAILLPDGRVAVVGSCDTICVDIWDPATDTITPAGASAEVHGGPTVTLLQDGRILVTGGTGAPHKGCRGSADITCYGPTDGAEVWDPATVSFSPTGSMQWSRSMHTATLLQDGRVLVVGGDHLATAELFELTR